MVSSLSSLVVNLAAGLHNTKCEKCNLAMSTLVQRHHDDIQMSKPKQKLWGKFDECDFTKTKTKKKSKANIVFFTETLTNFASYYRKLLIHMSTWMASKTSMVHHFPQKVSFVGT